MTTPLNTTVPMSDITLDITGMTCTSCSGRVERKLGKLDGVDATVNFATETASVKYDPNLVTPEDLIATVKSAGYSATVAGGSAAKASNQAVKEQSSADAPHSGTASSEQASGAHDHSGAHTPSDANAALARDIARRTIIAAVLSVPVMVLSMYTPSQFPGWQWVALALAVVAYVYCGAPFHKATWVNLKHGAFTMDTLTSLGTTAALGWSIYTLLSGHFNANAGHGSSGAGHIYLESVGMVITFLLLGRWIEIKAKGQSSEALRSLLSLGAKEATVIRDGQQVTISVDELQVGDVFLVLPGQKIATDGTVLSGESTVDESMLTGEPMPVNVEPGSTVTGSTINGQGRLEVRAERVGADTAFAHIAKLVADAQAAKAPIQRLVDRIAQVFVPAVIVAALITLVAHLLLGHTASAAVMAAVSVLIIACPCAMGLATPTAILVGTSRAAQDGILIKGPEVLESTRKVDTIVLDKTGTITEGAMQVSDVKPADGTDENTLLRLAAGIEQASEHPIARAIVTAYQNTGVGSVPEVQNFQSTTGFGVEGTVEGKTVQVGRPDEQAAQAYSGIGTLFAVRVDSQLAGHIEVSDTVREDSIEAIARFKELGLEPYLLTGDNERAAAEVARNVGIDHVKSQVMPSDKVDHIRELQAQGKTVAMVGDGINDAAALAAADLGIAMGSGSDVAIEASDITLMKSSLGLAARSVEISRRTLGIIKGNLFWAFGYNVILIPIAAIGLLNPMIAGFAMAFSSVFVVTNSLRLRNK